MGELQHMAAENKRVPPQAPSGPGAERARHNQHLPENINVYLNALCQSTH